MQTLQVPPPSHKPLVPTTFCTTPVPNARLSPNLTFRLTATLLPNFTKLELGDTDTYAGVDSGAGAEVGPGALEVVLMRRV